MINESQVGGIRFDAVKHFSEDFLIELCNHITQNISENMFFVGILSLITFDFR